jgi:hypothetical protein
MRTSRPSSDGKFDFLGMRLCSPRGDPETWHLPRATQLPPVPGLPDVGAQTTTSTGARMTWTTVPSAMSPRPQEPRSHLTKFVIRSAVPALVAGYFVFVSSLHHMEVPPSPLPLLLPSSEGQPQIAEAHDVSAESGLSAEIRTTSSPSAVRIESAESEADGKSPQPNQLIKDAAMLDEKSAPSNSNSVHQASPGLSAAVALDAQDTNTRFESRQFDVGNPEPSICFSSASAVRQDHPEDWPSWTLRARGHEGIKCWYPATRTTARVHPK